MHVAGGGTAHLEALIVQLLELWGDVRNVEQLRTFYQNNRKHFATPASVETAATAATSATAAHDDARMGETTDEDV
jgi:hypothetical protein